jgi:predicted Rossmann-fold nucleotide-binding protein
MINRIAVFCGSGFGSKPIFRETAYKLGLLLSQKDFSLVYGGSATGLMGV